MVLQLELVQRSNSLAIAWGAADDGLHDSRMKALRLFSGSIDCASKSSLSASWLAGPRPSVADDGCFGLLLLNLRV